jgi:hypothetical protein
MLKIPSKYEQGYFVKVKLVISVTSSFCFAARWLLVELPESSGERMRNIPCRYHSAMVLQAHVSSTGRTIGLLVAAVQRRSLIPSTSSSSSISNDAIKCLALMFHSLVVSCSILDPVKYIVYYNTISHSTKHLCNWEDFVKWTNNTINVKAGQGTQLWASNRRDCLVAGGLYASSVIWDHG